MPQRDVRLNALHIFPDTFLKILTSANVVPAPQLYLSSSPWISLYGDTRSSPAVFEAQGGSSMRGTPMPNMEEEAEG